MKTIFFSEIGSPSGILHTRTFANMRTDVAWSVALKAPIYNFDATNFESDLGIIIVPKKSPEKAINFHSENIYKCKRWAVMQEANQTYWQNFEVPTQIQYLQLLNSVDLIFCHNEIDVKYYNGLLNAVKSFLMPSLMIVDAVPQEAKKVPQKRNGSQISGNLCEWYCGLDSFMIAQEFGEQIYAPSMGRKQEYEDYLEDIRYLPYMTWADWMTELNKRKYAVNLMRTFAAGTFSLNCGFLGIPCLGWDVLDTQRLCFPELSIPVGDMVEARRMAKHLKNNELFYNHVSEYARKVSLEHFGEETFVKNFNNILKNI
jgi:hypothetical protein